MEDARKEDNAAQIAKLEEHKESQEAELGETIAAMEDTAKEIASMEDARKEDNAAYLQGKSDAQAAIDLLNQAKEALGKYYAENKIDLGPEEGLRLVQKPPPDATFKKSTNRKYESKGIISILSMVVEDLQAGMKTAMQDEEKAQLKFEEMLASAKKLANELKEKKTNLEGAIEGVTADITTEGDTKKDNEGSKKDEEKLREEIEPDCEFMAKHIDERRSKRQVEMDGLVSAKEYLAGAQMMKP